MKKIAVENAVGTILAHDITRIVPGEFKGVAYKKGHVVREEDVGELLKLGKKHLYVLELPEDHLHEDDAAMRIARAVSDDSLHWSRPSEGKSNITAGFDGLLKINPDGLLEINRLGNLILSTLKNRFPCKADQMVAATRIIPLSISEQKIIALEKIAETFYPIVRVLPFQTFKVGALVTGTEIYEGLISDGFDQYVGPKLKAYGCDLIEKILVPDDPELLAEALKKLINNGCELIITTGGLSVDPDDVTREGVRRSGAEIVVYGAPVLPGAMFLYAVLDDIPILGLPACVYYHQATIFDLVFPRILAGEAITENQINAMGHGGLCLNCDSCRFPVCPFGG